MAYTLVLDPRAIRDIQKAIDYYDEQRPGLGKRFEAALNKNFKALKKNPFFYTRYDNVRCLPLKNFPFMVHFTLNEDQMSITVQAVFHTSLDPSKWKDRK